MANSVDPDQTAPIGAVCSGSTLFASIHNLSVMLGNYVTYHLDLIYMYTKNHQNIAKGKRVIEPTSFPLLMLFKVDNSIGSKGEQPFLNVTHRLDLIYMYTKYHQNISKGKSY